MRKTLATIAALAVVGTGYAGLKTDYKKAPQVAEIFKKTVIQRKDYESVLLEELENADDEETANNLIGSGYEARKRINKNRETAEGFVSNPYDLRILIEHTPEGEKAYLFDSGTEEKLAIYENKQIGNMKHRLKGVEISVEELIAETFEDAKYRTIKSFEKVIEKLEGK